MLIFAILLYISLLLLIFLFKPSFMFDINGNFKTYNSKSLLTLDIVYPVLALLSYFIVLVIKIILI
jgi:hypothetical protein